MDLTKILSITGRPGLYKHVAQSRKGIVIESLADGTGSTAFASEHVSSLQDIAIFTYGEDVPLYEVFQAIYRKEDGKSAISHKSSPEELKKYFEEVLPDYDKERVYVSNIKRIIQWYNLLLEKDLIDLEKPESEKEESDSQKQANSNESIEEEQAETPQNPEKEEEKENDNTDTEQTEKK